MLEYKGKHTTAKVMIDSIDESTASQIHQFISHEAFTNPIAIMPDCHAGKGAVIGFTMEVTDKVIPNVIGVDIGCGMLSFNMSKSFLSRMSKEEVDRAIRNVVPFGTSVRSKVSKHFTLKNFAHYVRPHIKKFHEEYQKRFTTTVPFIDFTASSLEDICKVVGMDYDRCLKSIGTLGGGNHFIEVGKSENTGDYIMTIHCGSRQFGLSVAEFWQRQARFHCTKPTVSKSDYIDAVKQGFTKKEWQAEIAKYEDIYQPIQVEKGSEYLEGLDMYMYLYHMVVAQAYAVWNRCIIKMEILDALDVASHSDIETTHNFIDFNDWIIRKGAIRSYEGESMIIPFNMEDGILICEGKSNPEWNCSAPHGAGRLFSRSEAKKKLNLAKAEKSMKDKGIYSSNIPLDECKDAYKPAEVIEAAIEPTAVIIDRVKPVLNMKDK